MARNMNLLGLALDVQEGNLCLPGSQWGPVAINVAPFHLIREASSDCGGHAFLASRRVSMALFRIPGIICSPTQSIAAYRPPPKA